MSALKNMMGGLVKPVLIAVTQRLLNISTIGRRVQSSEKGHQLMAVSLLQKLYPNLVNPDDQKLDINNAELKVYSQHGEDGILMYLFSKIGITNRRFVEFGIQDGIECNTANLSLNFGWCGLLLDGDPHNVKSARDYYARQLGNKAGNVQITECFVTTENINVTLRRYGSEGDIDLLSIDIDGNDYWIWRSIDAINPRTVVIEYNATFGAERSVTIPYDPKFRWQPRYPALRHYFGASLGALTKLAHQKGYVLVGCESEGANAFFVRSDVAEGVFKEVTIMNAYYPLKQYEHDKRNGGMEPLLAATCPIEDV